MNSDKHILACVGSSPRADHVADYAAWAARRLAAPLEFLHLIALHAEPGRADDRSGAIGVDAQEHLLSKLASDDAQAARLARERAREHLQGLRLRALASGADPVDGRLRYGEVEQTVAQVDGAARMVVIGRHPGAGGDAPGGVDVERIVRASSAPVLTVPGGYHEPERAVIAFEGGAASLRRVQLLSSSALLARMHIDLLMCGKPTAAAANALREARCLLEASGLVVEASLAPGDIDTAIDAALARNPVDLLVMGGYSHSPVRTMLAGSRTTRLLRAFPIPTLLLR